MKKYSAWAMMGINVVQMKAKQANGNITNPEADSKGKKAMMGTNKAIAAQRKANTNSP